MKKKLNLSSIVLMLCLFGYVHNASAQRTIADPKFIDSFGDLSEVCSAPGDVFMATAILRPGSAMPPGNEYVLELSDDTGDFSNPVEIGRVVGPNNGSSNDLTIEFLTVTIPEGTVGDFYRIRVTTTETSDVSESSDPIPIYYYRNDLALRINGARNIILCDVTTFTKDLTVDITDVDDGSTVDADDFVFQWFRGAFPGGTIISGATGPTLTITQNDLDGSGNAAFYAQINLGICNSQFSSARSNNIRIALIDENPTIIGGPTFNFCPGDMEVLESDVENSIGAILNYQWFKDDEPIEGAILPFYMIPNDNFEGEYFLRVIYSEDCSLPTPRVTVINEGSSITSPLVGDLIILPTQTITLEITTDAPLAPAASSFQWFRNGSPLTGALELTDATISLDVTTPGEYRIDILADDDCLSELRSTSNIFEAIGFDMTIAITEGSDCDDENITLELEEIVGFTTPGSGGPPEIPLTEEQYAFFNFEWFRDDTSTGITATSIDISTSDQGAIYRLEADLITGEFLDILSNELSINPIPADIAISVLSTELPATLSVEQNPNYTYLWFRVVNGEEQEIVGETGNTIVVNEEGVYFVRVSSGICERDTPQVTIGPPIGPSSIIPNVVTPNSDNINDNWLLPNDLVGQQDVEVNIYNSRGELDFSGTSYQNNWPSENSASQGQNSTYYYIITKNSTVVRKGSITVVR